LEAVLGFRVAPNVVNRLDRVIDWRTCATGQPIKLVKSEPNGRGRGKRMMELSGK